MLMSGQPPRPSRERLPWPSVWNYLSCHQVSGQITKSQITKSQITKSQITKSQITNHPITQSLPSLLADQFLHLCQHLILAQRR
jgi:hypothetical protein